MTLKNLLKVASMGLAFVSVPAFALESDRNQPIEIEADQGTLDQKNQSTTFSGNVIVKQGTLNIRADKVTVVRDAASQQLMTADGKPVRFSQTLDANKGTVNGQANKVEYSSATGLVKLTGNAKVVRGGDKAEGALITYNTRTEIYTVNGSPAAAGKTAKRAVVVIQPSSTK